MKKLKLFLPVLLAGVMLFALIFAAPLVKTGSAVASTHTALQTVEAGAGSAETVSEGISSHAVATEQQFDGLEVKWTGSTDTYNLTSTSKSVEIDVSNIEVKEINENGVAVGEPLPASQYTVELYNGGKKVELTDGKATVDEGGTYQVWASKPSSRISGYTCKGFARVYVMNGLLSLKLNKTSVTTQSAGRVDNITATWNYTLTYTNWNTQQLSADDVTVTGFNPKKSGNGTATARYTTVNAKGEVVSASIDVSYNITGSYTPNMLLFNANDYEEEDIIANKDIFSATKSDGTSLSGNGLGSIQVIATAADKCNVTLTNVSSNLGTSVDTLTFTQRLKLNGTSYVDRRSVKLELVGAAAITVIVSSNSAGSPRKLALLDNTYYPIDESFSAGPIAQHTFEVSEGGTYYLGSMNSDMSIYYILVEYEA